MLLSVPSTWPQPCLAATLQAETALQQALVDCMRALPALRTAQRRGGGAVPRWQELGSEALRWLLSAAPQHEEVLTQLSDVLRELPKDWTQPSGEAARDLVEGVGRHRAAYDRWAGRGLVCWAPYSPGALGALVATYARWAATAPIGCTLRLVAALPLPPGCAWAGHIQDLVQHPLLGAHWAALVKGVVLSPRPLNVVTTGSTGPRQEWVGLLVATLRLGGERVPLHVHLDAAAVLAAPIARGGCGGGAVGADVDPRGRLGEHVGWGDARHGGDTGGS